MNTRVWQDNCGRFGSHTTPSELIEIKATYLGDSFGPETSSVARVKGPLCHASIAPGPVTDSLEYNDGVAWWNITLNTATWKSLGHHIVHFDNYRGLDLADVLRDPIYLLAVRVMDRAGNRYEHVEYWCLILIPVESKRVHFRRIGFIRFWDPDYEHKEVVMGTWIALNQTLAKCFICNDISEHMYEMVDSSYKYTLNLV